jgi:hypothetical protein
MANPYSPGLSPGPQARFKPDEFVRFIESHGLLYRWSRALVCPCTLTPEVGAFDPTCERCVDGWLYVNPLSSTQPELVRDYTPVKAIVSQITLDTSNAKWIPSPWVTNRGTITVLGSLEVSYKDRFVAMDQRMTLSQTLYRGASLIVPVGWFGRAVSIQQTALKFEPLKVHYVVDEDGDVYRQGADYELIGPTATEPARVAWKSTGSSPAEGVRFSISYDCHPVWKIDDATFAIQNSIGPATGLSGTFGVQYLPTTYSIALDWLPSQQGS